MRERCSIVVETRNFRPFLETIVDGPNKRREPLGRLLDEFYVSDGLAHEIVVHVCCGQARLADTRNTRSRSGEIAIQVRPSSNSVPKLDGPLGTDLFAWRSRS
jgi:hypothetical protein